MQLMAALNLRAQGGNWASHRSGRFPAQATNSRDIATCGMPSPRNCRDKNRFGKRVTTKVVVVTCRHSLLSLNNLHNQNDLRQKVTTVTTISMSSRLTNRLTTDARLTIENRERQPYRQVEHQRTK